MGVLIYKAQIILEGGGESIIYNNLWYIDDSAYVKNLQHKEWTFKYAN